MIEDITFSQYILELVLTPTMDGLLFVILPVVFILFCIGVAVFARRNGELAGGCFFGAALSLMLFVVVNIPITAEFDYRTIPASKMSVAALADYLNKGAEEEILRDELKKAGVAHPEELSIGGMRKLQDNMERRLKAYYAESRNTRINAAFGSRGDS